MSDAPSQPPKVPPGVYTTKPPITPSPLALAERLEQQARILLDALEHGTFFPELGEAAAMAFRASVVSAAAQAVIAVDAVRSSAGAGERMAGFAHAAYKAVTAANGPTSPYQQAAEQRRDCSRCHGPGYLSRVLGASIDETPCRRCAGVGLEPAEDEDMGGGS